MPSDAEASPWKVMAGLLIEVSKLGYLKKSEFTTLLGDRERRVMIMVMRAEMEFRVAIWLGDGDS